MRMSAGALLRSLVRDWSALIGAVLLLTLVTLAVFAPLIAPQNPYDPLQLDILNSKLPPVWMEGADERFPLGTDEQGRGVLSVILYGMRVSLLIGLGAVALQALIGVVIGLISGFVGGLVDAVMMRIADIQLSLSTLMLAIIALAVFQTAFGKSAFNDAAVWMLILVLGLAEWPQYARTVRANVLAEREKEYVDAARIVGMSGARIMGRHVLPNTLTPVLVISTLQVGNMIVAEAGLSFLGLGMPVNQPSLGSLIRAGYELMLSGKWWITSFPAFVLIALVLSINLLGDWLRDTLNPKLYRGV